VTEESSSLSSKTKARQTLSEAQTCTLATASQDGVPEAATIRFVSDQNLDMYITTESMYRKYENMTVNPRVALVVDGSQYNLQLEGVATEAHGETAEFIKQKYTEKYGSSKYLNNDDSVFFEIIIDWARLLVDGQFPPEFEMVIGSTDSDPHRVTAGHDER
jgi:Pyridoxamine 5''-phosphate oxidase.